jgi:hypothetical protein
MRGTAAACVLLAASCLCASAQTLPAAGAAAGQPTNTTELEQKKAESNAPRAAPAERSASGRGRFTPPPMNIRIQEEGVKLPKCTAESREGEECKK